MFFFFTSVMCGWSICYVLRVHSLGVAPRYEFSCVVRIDEMPCTDPLPLYAEFFTSRAIGRSIWLYGGVVDSDGI